MKSYIRTAKHSLDHLTGEKKEFIWKKKNEWAYIGNKFIYLYDKEVLSGEMTLFGAKKRGQRGALQPYIVQEIIKDLPFKATSRFAKCAIDFAFRAIKSQKALIEKDLEENKAVGNNVKPRKYKRPKLKPKMMELNENIATFIPHDKIKNKAFDGLIKLSNLGYKDKNGKPKAIYIPYKETEFSRKLESTSGKKCKTIKLGKTLNVSYETEIDKKKNDGEVVAIDLNCSDDLISTSTRKHYGTEIREYIDSLNNKKQYSKGWYSAQKSLYHYIDKCLHEFYKDHSEMSYLLVENLKNVKNKMAQKSRLNKRVRKIISKWYYAYVLKKLEEYSEKNCVRIRRFPTPYLSQKCSHCGYVDKKNRSGAVFNCSKRDIVTNEPLCHHTDHSGFNSTDNILELFFQGAYRPLFKSRRTDEFHIFLSF